MLTLTYHFQSRQGISQLHVTVATQLPSVIEEGVGTKNASLLLTKAQEKGFGTSSSHFYHFIDGSILTVVMQIAFKAPSQFAPLFQKVCVGLKY